VTNAFDRFTQFGNRDGGMGVGLAICKAIFTRAHATAPNS
jgi:signal transduction histidine kinase